MDKSINPLKFILSTFALLFLTAASGMAKHHDWKNIIDGDLSKVVTEGNWIVEDDMVFLEPRPGEKGWTRYDSYLWLKDEYDDFICKFEFKFAQRGNSGFYFRVADEADPVVTGLEVQLTQCHKKEKIGWHDLGGIIKFKERSAGDPKARATKEPGEWNTARVTMQGNHLTVIINGVLVHDRLDLSQHEIDGAPLAAKGKIGFQDHGIPFWLRNIRIKKL
ncbi:MAG TPA: DUF1080 domain-containing protein [Opitutales bacterium]|nr:DUF1080 domain-containing protein [Opitutales bacterium]